MTKPVTILDTKTHYDLTGPVALVVQPDKYKTGSWTTEVYTDEAQVVYEFLTGTFCTKMLAILAAKLKGEYIPTPTSKDWGVMAYSLERPGGCKWYTNERHTEDEARKLADSYNKVRFRPLREQYKAERIPEGDNY